MPGITITATAGSATANSFASEAAFIAYAATRLNVPTGTTVSGSTCSEPEKKALIEATRELDNMDWRANRTTTTQALSWPRSYVENPDAAGLMGTPSWSEMYFVNTIVPARVINATCELALEFLKAGTSDLASADLNAGVIRKKTDVLETEWTPYARAEGMGRFPRVLAYVGPMLENGAGSLDVERQ